MASQTGFHVFKITRAAAAWMLFGACFYGGCSKTTPVEEETSIMSMTISSSAFQQGQKIPAKYTGDSEDISPPLNWAGFPEKTASFVLICDDPDAPTAEPWVHWLVYNIPPSVTSLEEDVILSKLPRTLPVGIAEGKTSWGTIGYGGPAPPKGHGTHHYHFKIYALSFDPQLRLGLEKNKLFAAIKDSILAEGELIGTYER